MITLFLKRKALIFQMKNGGYFSWKQIVSYDSGNMSYSWVQNPFWYRDRLQRKIRCRYWMQLLVIPHSVFAVKTFKNGKDKTGHNYSGATRWKYSVRTCCTSEFWQWLLHSLQAYFAIGLKWNTTSIIWHHFFITWSLRFSHNNSAFGSWKRWCHIILQKTCFIVSVECTL